MIAEIEIQRVGLEGQGVGYDPEGNIYFVPGAVPGDKIRAEFAETKKKYRDAELVEILQQSPDRRKSDCDYFQQCGGCDWLNWDYKAQLKAKDAMLRHVLERAQLLSGNFHPIRGATQVLGYRNRVQLRSEGGHTGFLRRRSHEIVDIERCVVANRTLNEEIARLRTEVPRPERTKIELSLLENGSVVRMENAAHAAAGFSQVNPEQNEVLRELVAQFVKRAQAHLVLELFCGNGNLTFAYLPFVEKVIAADSNVAAIQAARVAKAAGDEERVAFVHSLVGHGLAKMLPADFKGLYDTVVLDPPRSGISRDLERWVSPVVRNIIYVSCSPASFSQDVVCLKKNFALVEVQAVDMFPQTRHIEFVARFQKTSSH